MTTRETHKSASPRKRPKASVKSKPEEIDLWGSEVPIVAENSGNAEGAKGHRFEQSDTKRHAPDTGPELRVTPEVCRLALTLTGSVRLELGAGWINDPSPVLRGPWGRSPRLLSKTHP
jgi:hypothetical protein